MSPRRLAALDVALIAAVSITTGVTGLGSKSFWLDEGYSGVEAEVRGTHNFALAWYHGDPNQTLYYLVLHLWSYLGNGEASLRSLSVIFAVAAAAMTYVLGRELGGRVVGLTAGLLLAISPFEVTYAQTARGYSLLVLLTAASTWLFLRTLRDDRRRYWLTYAVLTAAGCYVHYFMGMVLATQVAYLVLTQRDRAVLRRAARNLAVVAVLAAPIAFHAARANEGGISWIEPTSASNVLHIGYRIAGGRALFALVTAAVLATAVIAVRRRGTSVGRAALLVVLGGLLPIALGLIAAATLHPIMVDRYFIECLPMAVLAMSMVAWRLPSRWLSVVALAVLVGLSINGLVGWYQAAPIQDWRAATRYMLATAPHPRLVAALPSSALTYYLQRDAPGLAAEMAAQPAECRGSDLLPVHCLDGARSVALVGGPDRFSYSGIQSDLEQQGYVREASHSFEGLIVIRYSKPER